jgi:hypothetical protein
MTIQEAQQNIGQPFRVEDIKIHFKNGTYFETIREVTPAGEIIGDYVDAMAEDCRLKQEVPAQLRKSQ